MQYYLCILYVLYNIVKLWQWPITRFWVIFFRLDLPFPVPQTNYEDFAPRILSFPELSQLSPMSPRNWPGWGVRPPLLPIVLAWWMPSRGRSFEASHPDVFFQETQCWKEKPPISGNAQVISNLQSLVKQDEQALKIWIWADHWRSGSASPLTSPGPWQLEVRGEICGAQCWTNLTSHIRAPSSATWQPRHIRNLFTSLFTSLTLTIRITSQEYSGFRGPSEVLIWCMSVISFEILNAPSLLQSVDHQDPQDQWSNVSSCPGRNLATRLTAGRKRCLQLARLDLVLMHIFMLSCIRRVGNWLSDR